MALSEQLSGDLLPCPSINDSQAESAYWDSFDDALNGWYVAFDRWGTPISTSKVLLPPWNLPNIHPNENLFTLAAEPLKLLFLKGPNTLAQWQAVLETPYAPSITRDPSLANGLPIEPVLSLDSSSSESAAATVSPTALFSGDSSVSYQSYTKQRTASPEVNGRASTQLSVEGVSPHKTVETNPEPKKTSRRRGRPGVRRYDFDVGCISTDPPSSHPSSRTMISKRLPHNQVERKYREGLNSQLERLRRAIPNLRQPDSTDLTGRPKPAKAMVLASAIDYIMSLETERDRQLVENESLRAMCHLHQFSGGRRKDTNLR